MSASRNHLAGILVLVLFVLSACNLPRKGAPAQSEVEAIFTAAAQTRQAQLTEISGSPATSSVKPTAPGTPVPGATPPLPVTPIPGSGTPSSLPCDRVKLIADVTYPDGTEVAPGTTFVKTWRLQNAGSCAWTSAYTVVFSGGDALGAPASLSLTTGTVAPGENIDVSITMKAPDSVGKYRGNWKLRNASGQDFGIGPNNTPFWVRIDVVVGSGLVYDFVVQAASAVWGSGVGNTPSTPLAFGGADDDPNGAASYKQDVRLESGAQSGKLLFTVPKHVENGMVAGVFLAYTVQSGDHLKVRVGFMANADGSCGAGKVKFEIGYKDGAAIQSLGNWNKTCTSSLLPVDIDLSPLAGKTVQFILAVVADGPFRDDRTVWNSPRITH